MAGGPHSVPARHASRVQAVREAHPQSATAAQAAHAVLTPPTFTFAPTEVPFDLAASPPGVTIQFVPFDTHAELRIRERSGAHIAHVRVIPPPGVSPEDEALEIAHGLYFSWWRAQKVKP